MYSSYIKVNNVLIFFQNSFEDEKVRISILYTKTLKNKFYAQVQLCNVKYNNVMCKIY